MKKLFLAFLLVLIVSALYAQTGKAVVNFAYAKQSGFSSNQFAVWIEDAQGTHVKTLYATKFTATGGWKKRENSLPLWVKQSNLPGLNKAQIDAVTGPTPKPGALSFTWDGTDSAGRTLPAGEYKVMVEGTLRNENRVLYTAVIKPGESGKVTAQAQYFGTGTAERGMIGLVTVTY